MREQITLIIVLFLLILHMIFWLYIVESTKKHEENYNNIYMSINKLQEQFNNWITITIE